MARNVFWGNEGWQMEMGQRIQQSKIDIEKTPDLFSLIDSVQNGIVAVDEAGILTLMNAVAEQILKVNRGNALGRPVSEIFENTKLLDVLESREPQIGQKVRFNDVTIMANYSPIFNRGKLRGAVSVFQDITTLENTSLELRNVQELIRELEATIHSSYDGIFITDGDGVVLRLNEAYERISGLRADEILGKKMSDLVAARIFDQSVTLLVMKERRRVTINQIIRGDHKVLVTGNPIFDDRGNLFRVVTNVRDITELAGLQEQLAETKAQTLKYKTELSHLRSMNIRSDEIIFRSAEMEKSVELALKIADFDTNVLITGESGTGKEVIAKLIHNHGKGISKPFLKVNCAAIPEHLLESELFGYESGAFTGARKEGKPGLFELAHKGTLFLDEVGDMPLVLQAKLLRAIQDKSIMRVGGVKSIQVQVRIIAATHQHLLEMVKEGRFRSDLYYRLMVVPIHLLPLRERKDDIPLLAKYFLDKYNAEFGCARQFSSELVDCLVKYPWLGNVRELENLVERLVVISNQNRIGIEDLPAQMINDQYRHKPGSRLKTAVEQLEARMLMEAYREYSSWAKVAEVLDVDRSTVFRKAAKYQLLSSAMTS